MSRTGSEARRRPTQVPTTGNGIVRDASERENKCAGCDSSTKQCAFCVTRDDTTNSAGYDSSTQLCAFCVRRNHEINSADNAGDSILTVRAAIPTVSTSMDEPEKLMDLSSLCKNRAAKCRWARAQRHNTATVVRDDPSTTADRSVQDERVTTTTTPVPTGTATTTSRQDSTTAGEPVGHVQARREEQQTQPKCDKNETFNVKTS